MWQSQVWSCTLLRLFFFFISKHLSTIWNNMYLTLFYVQQVHMTRLYLHISNFSLSSDIYQLQGCVIKQLLKVTTNNSFVWMYPARACNFLIHALITLDFMVCITKRLMFLQFLFCWCWVGRLGYLIALSASTLYSIGWREDWWSRKNLK
jgi:hypothetical protein